MKKELLTLTAVLLTLGVSSCSDDTKTTTSTSVEAIEPASTVPVIVEDKQVTQDAYGNSTTVVKHSQAYVPAKPTIRKTTTTETKTED